jgi:hypothetical protein
MTRSQTLPATWRFRRPDRRVLTELALSLTPLLLASASWAANFTVFNTNDLVDVLPGDGVCDADPSPPGFTCTLRAAVMEATALPGPDVIQLGAGTYLLTIPRSGLDSGIDMDNEGDLDVRMGDLEILGCSGCIVDGNDLGAVFQVHGGASLTLRQVEVRNGTNDFGGCIEAGGDLTLDRVEMYDCVSDSSTGTSSGGGIFIDGDLIVIDSWIRDNTAFDGVGGAIRALDFAFLERTTLSGNFAFRGGGIASTNLVMINSTVVENFTTGIGGGIFANGSGNVYSSTIANNRCDVDSAGGVVGGGIFLGSGTWHFANSVIAQNDCTFTGAVDQDCSGTFISDGYNFIGLDDSCNGFTAVGDQVGPGPTPIDPGFAPPLALNGGFSPNLPPLPSSPLVDAGNPAGCLADYDGSNGPLVPVALTIDQRGVSRLGTGCEIGAVESGLLFADGLESGNTGEWSTTIP